ncbi:hypothetical protein [Sphingomonas sanguinis]|jgi:hypothetical protein|uniref:Uncharacterized protein n=2 Tax=Sphingomonas sanguinis TaxID=33051 RepID=A0A7Y7QZ01_9SPHN|nr:hypothetical protein [Sphingomonas sanguinis]MBZ6383760.1 hypothetical protein [Sphingomonas sanguinis]NNG49709.1 hypothetical protein [Sphingomonas sanguinis]NVP33051.1 hypothetical protein [Sphingomonas sanguinis]
MTSFAAPLRIAAVLGGGAVAMWVALGVTMDFTIARKTPAVSQRLWPAGVTGRVAEGRDFLAGNPTRAQVLAGRERVRDAALREPVNTHALSILAAFDDYLGDKRMARTLFTLAERQSRRNVLAQLWLIEDAVARNDVPRAIRHYDRTMRVSVEMRDTLLPILVSAGNNPEIRNALAATLRGRPLWWKDYMRQLAAKGEDGALLAASLAATRPDLDDVQERVLAENVLRRMVTLGHGGDAARLANRIEGQSGAPPLLKDGGFETGGGLLPFAWQLNEEGSLRAYRDAVPGGEGLRIDVAGDTSATAAQQLLALAPGRYALTGRTGNIAEDRLSRPTIQLSCADGKSLARFALPAAADSGTRFRFAFDVPGSCAVQWMAIVATATNDADIWIDDLAITR